MALWVNGKLYQGATGEGGGPRKELRGYIYVEGQIIGLIQAGTRFERNHIRLAIKVKRKRIRMT